MIIVFDPIFQKTRTWTHCELEGPCFLLTIDQSELSDLQSSAAVVRCAYELLHYLRSPRRSFVKCVQMMTPPNINGCEHWKVHELISIVVHSGVDCDDSTVVYVTTGGTYKLGSLDLRRKKQTRILYTKNLMHTLQENSVEPRP